jgi:hypothetical protein
MSRNFGPTAYAEPVVTDLGTLRALTANSLDAGMIHFAQIPVGSLGGSPTPGGTPTTPDNTGTPNTPGDTGQVLPDTASSPGATPTPSNGSVLDQTASGNGGGSNGGGTGAATPVGGGGGAGTRVSGDALGSGEGSLPFTGLAVGGVAAAGAALTSAGAALRRLSRR